MKASQNNRAERIYTLFMLVHRLLCYVRLILYDYYGSMSRGWEIYG